MLWCGVISSGYKGQTTCNGDPPPSHPLHRARMATWRSVALTLAKHCHLQSSLKELSQAWESTEIQGSTGTCPFMQWKNVINMCMPLSSPWPLKETPALQQFLPLSSPPKILWGFVIKSYEMPMPSRQRPPSWVYCLLQCR